MFEHRGSRFAVEVLVLVTLAASVTVAELNRFAIAGIMLLGWLVVSLLEWTSRVNEAHYGSGLPPRYYVPELSLPSARTSEKPAERSQSALPMAEHAWVGQALAPLEPA